MYRIPLNSSRRLWIGLSFVAFLLAVFALPSPALGGAAGRIYWTDQRTHKVQCAGIDIPPGETPSSLSAAKYNHTAPNETKAPGENFLSHSLRVTCSSKSHNYRWLKSRRRYNPLIPTNSPETSLRPGGIPISTARPH